MCPRKRGLFKQAVHGGGCKGFGLAPRHHFKAHSSPPKTSDDTLQNPAFQQ
jgi:hypothetical protein